MGGWRLAIGLCVAVFAARTSSAQQSYFDERIPKRWALVIGHHTYTELSAIPSAAVDTSKMSEKLAGIGFSVYEARFADVASFEQDVLVPFADRIERDDLVVVYYSGHGFASGANNFLAPTQMSKRLHASRLTEEAVPIEAVEDYLTCNGRGTACQQPGLVIILLDACRSLPGLEIEPVVAAVVPPIEFAAVPRIGMATIFNPFRRGPAATPVAGGFAEPRKAAGLAVNVLLGFSAREGQVSTGSSAPDQPSLFTKELAEHVADQGMDFEAIWDTVKIQVQITSNDQQQPGEKDWSAALAYLNPTPQQVADERTLWESAMAGSRQDVEYFRRRYSINRFVGEARNWLDDHPEDNAMFTLASPVAIERAWRPDNTRVAVRRLETSLALPRVAVGPRVEALSRESDAAIGVVPAGARSATLPRKERATRRLQGEVPFDAEQLASHPRAVTTREVTAFEAPSKKAPVAATFTRGEVLRVASIQQAPDASYWLELQSPQGQVFLPAESDRIQEPLELGRSLREVELAPTPGRPPELVDTEPLLAALRELRAQARTLRWVSLGSGVTTKEEPRELASARINSIRLALSQNGIATDRITAVIGAQDVRPGTIRVRLFGN